MRSGKIEILIVDDSSTNIVLLEAILEGEGYRVYKAQSAMEAKKILALENIHVVLLDILMPKISGFEFLDELKTNKNTKTIPIILISAISNEESVKKAYELGAADFIEKPINVVEVIEKVETHLNFDRQDF